MYLLDCIRKKSIPDTMINMELELKKLKSTGYLLDNLVLTEKALTLFGVSQKRNDYLSFIQQYRNLFPAGKIWGYYKRDSPIELKERFDKFFKKYDYDYDLILKATKQYVEDERSNEGWKYLKNSAYVIEKKGEPCLLAKLCEEFYNTDSTVKDFTDE